MVRVWLIVLSLFGISLCWGDTTNNQPSPKSASESLDCIRVPPSFKVEIVASEPLIESPVAFEWGADGKLWVVEMRDYPNGGPDSTQRRYDAKAEGKNSSNEGVGEGPSPHPGPLPSHPMGAEREGNTAASARPTSLGLAAGGGFSRPGHNGRIVFLEDTNGGGVYNKATVFLDGLSYPNGICPWRKGVVVSAGGEIFYAYSTNGNGKADVRKTILSGFSLGNPQHRVNGFDYGLDNWLYAANGDNGGRIRSFAGGGVTAH
jgi:glucose/arabinose dehydrogenase